MSLNKQKQKYLRPIKASYGIQSVSESGKEDVSKARWWPSNPYVVEATERFKKVFKLFLIRTLTKARYEDFYTT